YRAGLGVADSLKRLIQVRQTNDIDVRAYTKRMSGSESLSDSLSAVMQRIVETNSYAKEAMAALLETDYLSDTYAELDTVNRVITYYLKPLPKFTVVNLSGSRHLQDNAVTKLFAPLFRNNYTNREATRKLEALVKAYREKGYCLVDLTSIKVVHDSLFITTNGDKLSSIELLRSRKWTHRHVIDREISFDTTHSLKYKQVESSITQLYNMGIFSRVSMWPSYKADSAGAVSPGMVVKLDERFAEVLRFGFRVDDIYSSQFLLDFRNENFLGLATELGGWTTIGTRNFSAQIEFRAHRLWNTYLTFFTRMFYEQRNIYQTDITFSDKAISSNRNRLGEYGQQFYGASVAVGGQIYRDGQATIEFLNQNAQVYPSSFNSLRENLAIKTMRFRFTLDTRNDPVDANTGTFMDIYYDLNPKFLGNDVIFSKIIFNYEDNFPITEAISWQLTLDMGVADNRTPISQQFSLGGVSSTYSTTFYGLRLDDYRGRQLFTVGLSMKFELPVQIVFPTSFGIHYNTGNVWPESRTLQLRNFIHGVGATLSLRTPIGPAQLSLSQAFRFSKTEESTLIRTAPLVYYFVLGYEF
ncbi:MAG: BamA/TamA family outer membrane protein, partial [Chlorobiales bacterium]|nr:BamA/TamA family outer membrane protein [Chlorobiales bacterium]